ncbi:MAG TPA: hypothetical protein VNO79_08755 [Actinomycetota bacterium]|nr:hypothetical protein [Actinomycetota bacterium]
MAVTSRIAAAQDGLLAALQAQAAGQGSPLAGVQLTLGWPVDQQAESCWVDEAGSAEQAFASTTSPSTAEDEETIRLTVRVLVRRGELSYKEARDRALAIAGEVHEALRADRTLGGAVFDAVVVGLDLESGVEGEARLVGVSVRVEARAFLA